MTNKMTNAQKLDMLLEQMGTINNKLEAIDKRVTTLEKGSKKPTTSKGKAVATKEKDTRTWTEKKAEYASKFSEAERKAYGEQKRAERTKQHTAYEKANEFFKDKGYVGKAEWRKKYNEILATL